MSTQMQKASHLELKKHVGLIHSANCLSLLERKIANALLYNAYDKLLDQEEHEIHIETLSALIGYNSKDYKTLRKSLKAIGAAEIEWNILGNDNQERWGFCHLLAGVETVGPICTYSYAPKMRQLCYFPEFYARVDLKTMAAFKSTYGIALYENCVRYRNIKHTPWMSMDLYRKLMGVGDGKYKDYKSLKRRVIKPSIAEVNEHSQLFVEPEFKKRGRVVSEIRFLIEENSKRILPTNGSVEDLLINCFGLSSVQTKEVTKLYDEEYIREKIKLITASKSYVDGKINNLTRYIISSLEGDYQPPKSSKEHRSQIIRQKEMDEVEKKRMAAKKDRYVIYLSNHLDEILENVSKEQKKEIVGSFENSIQKSMYERFYLKHGLGSENTIIKDKFIRFVMSNFKNVTDEFCSFNDFLAQEPPEFS